MKKVMSFFFISIFSFFLLSYSFTNVKAKNLPFTIIQEIEEKVMDKYDKNKIVLMAQYPNKGLYAQKIAIEIKDILSNKTLLTIYPKTNEGYLPKIIVEHFDDQSTKKIFLGMDSGGSGGFGFYYLFDVANGKVNVLFDYAQFDKMYHYVGNYEDHYKVRITSVETNISSILDLSLRPKEYLNELYFTNGKLKQPTTVDISGVNTVFPFFLTTSGYFQLEVNNRITGIANADSLGYITTYLSLRNGTFTPYFILMAAPLPIPVPYL